MPASGRFLLDTNIVIALLEGDDEVLSSLDLASEVHISAVVVGELFFGAAKSSRPAENTARVERFAADRSVLPCDLDVARLWEREAASSRERDTDPRERHLDCRHSSASRTGTGHQGSALL